MPLVPKQEVTQQDLYGMTKVESNLTMRERIKKRFRPTDTVQVQNITNQNLEWQWLDEQDENYVIEDDTNIKITSREDPGLWRLNAGETDVLPGSCAYLMIEALYKLVCVMKSGIVINPTSEREIRNFSFDDPERQEQFIDMVFLGKLTPQTMQRAAISALGTAAPRVTENLAPLPTEQEERARREMANRAITERPLAPAPSLESLAGEFEAGATLLGTATGGLPTDRQAPPAAPAAPPPVATAPAAPVNPPANPPAATADDKDESDTGLDLGQGTELQLGDEDNAEDKPSQTTQNDSSQPTPVANPPRNQGGGNPRNRNQNRQNRNQQQPTAPVAP